MRLHQRQWIVFTLSLLVFTAIVGYTVMHIKLPGPGGPGGSGEASPNPKTQQPLGSPPGADVGEVRAAEVSFVSVTPASYEARLVAYGSTRAQYELSLKAQVSGKVSMIADSFESGRSLAHDEVLLEIEDSDYRAALASAKADLADAKLNLLEAEREAVQAKAEWDAAGLQGEPDSELVLHRPQLEAAQAALDMAEAALASARRDLAYTRITAPFDAVVIDRLVAPGSYLQADTDVATLYGSERVEIELALPARDWLNLPDTDRLIRGDWPVTLISEEQSQQWTGRVLRVQQHIDEASRQRSLIVAVDQPFAQSPPLLPGTFLKADIRGREIEGLWRLPATALSQRSEIWYIREDDTLSSFAANPVFYDDGLVYLHPPDELAGSAQRIVVNPLNNYLQGMHVSPFRAGAMSAGDSKDGHLADHTDNGADNDG